MHNKSLFLQVNILPLVAAVAINIVSNTISDRNSVELLTKELVRAEQVNKVRMLEKFFEGYKSPLKAHSETFVLVAEKYGLDYRLLPAISCQESSCGKQLIEGSYNPFGWGIYGSNAIYFENYDEAIETVGKGLKENYLDKGFDTPQKIAPIYTPPSKGSWLYGVTFFMEKIEATPQDNKS
jgi:hypothetical protein